jgi:16S rRNA (uracil1498-N3)-methyltransferase
MTRRRWIADERSGNRAVLTGSHADHLARVLRARIGQRFDIATGSEVRLGTITSIEEGRVEFELGDSIALPSTVPVTLLLSVFKFDRMEWAIEKCTELGVGRIVPLLARRTEVHLAAAAPGRRERWQRIACHAAEQSRQLAPPRIAEVVKLSDAVGIAGDFRIVLAESGSRVMLSDALSTFSAGQEVVLAVGPEGGWAETEVELFERAGWELASLGDRVLRAETAAIVALALICSWMQGSAL